MGEKIPQTFKDVNTLRVELRHDLDHGDEKAAKAKRQKAGTTFRKYSGQGTPESINPVQFPLVQANLLSALENELRLLLLET